MTTLIKYKKLSIDLSNIKTPEFYQSLLKKVASVRILIDAAKSSIPLKLPNKIDIVKMEKYKKIIMEMIRVELYFETTNFILNNNYEIFLKEAIRVNPKMSEMKNMSYRDFLNHVKINRLYADIYFYQKTRLYQVDFTWQAVINDRSEIFSQYRNKSAFSATIEGNPF